MPEFSDWVEVEAEIDVTVDDFLSACSPKEIKELITALVEDGHISNSFIVNDKMSLMESDHRKYCETIANRYHSMTNDECEIIKKIAERYSV